MKTTSSDGGIWKLVVQKPAFRNYFFKTWDLKAICSNEGIWKAHVRKTGFGNYLF